MNSLPGAEQLFTEQFDKFLSEGDYVKAAKIAIEAPNNSMRTPETIQRFKSAASFPGRPPALAQYFSTLLESNIKLNVQESIDLVQPVLAQGRKDIIENWIKEEKLECSVQLGDLVKRIDPHLALAIYSKSGSIEKTVQGYAETGQFDLIVPFCKKNNFTPDYLAILRKMLDMGLTEKAVEFGKLLCNRGEHGSNQPMVQLNLIFDLFMSYNRVQDITAIMLEVLGCNKPEDAALQTKLFEINLTMAPKVVEAIFQMNMLTYYDKPKIAKLCEQAGLLARALELFTEIADIRRVIVNTHILKKEQIVDFLAKQDHQRALVCMNDLLKSSRQNMQLVVEACVKLHATGLNDTEVVKMFESYGSIDGIYLYLGQILPSVTDHDIVFKYIEAAAKLGNLREVERVVKETKEYDAQKVMTFLKEQKLSDPRALIYLCDKNELYDDLTSYLYKNNFGRHIEIYLFKVNPQAAPQVLGSLLNLECEEGYIKQLLLNIRMCPIDQLVSAFESRNKLRILQPWLEARAGEGNQTQELHTALAKIYIDINKDPQTFLNENGFYDSKAVGKYCEDRDAHLAFLAYKKAWGKCDKELIAVTNKNYLFRLQAKYLVERQDLGLWKVVLAETNECKKQLVEQVVQTALPETKNPDEVSTTVKAFMEAELQKELIELLDKIVLHTSEFSANSNLQTLLIFTAIKSDPSRVMEYVNRLDNYNAPKLGKKALEHGLNEEAFAVYQKANIIDEAMDVLVNAIKDLGRAAHFAEKVAQPNIWSKLGNAYLTAGQVVESIKAFIKAQDPSSYMMVIGAAERADKFDVLIDFLLMARQKMKDSQVDNALIYAYARCKKNDAIEDFLMQPNSANVEQVGDRCNDEQLYEASKILYKAAGKIGKLSSALVNIGNFQEAIEAAKKANLPKTWKEVNFACMRAKEFKLAAIAGLNIIVIPDYLEEIIANYEQNGYWEELIKLLDTGLQSEQAHKGMFTELGILLAKHMPSRLMTHLKTHFARLNVPKLLVVCEENMLWQEAVYLNSNYDQFDAAINIMIDHSPTAFVHDTFLANIQKVTSTELYYKAIKFYFEEQPLQINELLLCLANKLDLKRCVELLLSLNCILLAEPFLKSVQQSNNLAVNNALNELYLENEDHEALRASVGQYDKFDQLGLAQKLEKFPSLEFRRIAALLYKKNKKFAESIVLSQNDEMYKDAMETVLESKSPELAEKLLRYFVEKKKDKECFAACLYTCYELIKPDFAVELAWRYGMTEFSYPFLIQALRESNEKQEYYAKKVEELLKKEEKKGSGHTGPSLMEEMMGPQFPQLMPSPQTAAEMPGLQGVYFNTPMYQPGNLK